MDIVVLKISLSLVLVLLTKGAALAASPAADHVTDQRGVDTTATGVQGTAPSVRASGLNTDLILQIINAGRVVPPGGVVTLKYTLYSSEGTPGRIRLQVNAPLGWSLLDAGGVQREWLLEAWDIVTEELRVAAHSESPEGLTEVIRLTAEMVGAPGVAEAVTHVQVLNGAGVRPGGAHLAGAAVVGVSQLGAPGFDQAKLGGTVDLSGQLGKQSNLSFTYHQGPRESRSNYRYHQEEKYLSGSFVHSRWNVRFGNRISSSGNVLIGPSVSGEGVAVRHLNGRMLAEIVLARPTTFSGAGAGHLWRGSLGIKTARGTFGFAASDFGRPEGGYSTLPPVLDPTLDPDSLEELERERALSSGRTSTRVQGAGVEAALQLTRSHRLMLRGGALRLRGARREKVTAPSVEAQYSFSGRSATLNARVRQTPPTVQGVYLSGNERSADGTLGLVNELRLVGRAYKYHNETVGDGYRAGTEGASLGLRYTRRRWRVEVNGNRREAYAATDSVRRTARISLGLPLGPIAFTVNTELGREEVRKGVYRFRSYLGDLRWSGKPGDVSFTVSSYASGSAQPRVRADLLISLVSGGLELAGGAWATRGWAGGGAPGLWANIGLPVKPKLTLFLGLEHGPQVLAPVMSAWRFSVGLRQKLVVPLPFLRNDILQEPSQ